MRRDEYENLQQKMESAAARQKTANAVQNALRARDTHHIRRDAALACAWAAHENKDQEAHLRKRAVNEALSALLPPDSENIIAALEQHCTQDDLSACILWNLGLPVSALSEREFLTEALCSLVVRVLQPEAKDHVLNFGGGRRFMESLFTAQPDSAYVEVSHNIMEKHADVLRASLLDFDAAEFPERPADARYDKAFVVPPFSDWKNSPRIGVKEESDAMFLGADVKGVSRNWNEVAQVLRALNPGGIAAVLVPTGVLVSQREQPARRFLTENGMLRSVVALPAMLLQTTTLACALVLLQAGGSESIFFVDGMRTAESANRKDPLPKQAAAMLVGSLGKSSEISVSASRQAVEAEAHDWSPVRYLFARKFENTQPLGGLVRKIQRGSQQKYEFLEEYRSSEPTDVRCVQVGDLRDGILRPENVASASLTSVPQGMQTHVVPEKAIVLSKVGSGRFSCAVAENTAGVDLIATGNLYVLDLDKDKLDPYYLQAFFASEDGYALLQSISSGTSMLNLSQKELMRLEIPVPSMEKQREIGEAYRRLCEECADLRRRLALGEEQLKHVWH